MQDSIFTKIVKGELPCHRVYEDENTLAFLDIYSSVEGKTLVIPKRQVDQFIDLSDEDYDALWRSVKKVAARLREVTGKDRVGVFVEGVEVPHAHVHLIPFDDGEDLAAKATAKQEPNHEALEKAAEKLKIS